MSMPSWAHLGVGVGLTTLLIVAVAKATGSSDTRFLNVKGTTVRIKKLGGGNFEAAAWGEGVAFAAIPTTEPLATYVFGNGIPLEARGNPRVIDFLHRELPGMPITNLFTQEGSERCARPGCAV